MSTRVATAHIVHQSKTFAFTGGITINDSPQQFAVAGAYGGTADYRQNDSRHTITGTLDGRLVDVLAILFAYASASRGSLIFADNTLVVHCSDLAVYTYRNAALTSIGSINLTSKGIATCDVTFTCLHGSSYDVGDADGMFTATTAGSYTFPTIDPADMLSEPYTASWGASSPWDSFELLEGATANFGLTLVDVPDQRRGTQNMILSEMSASVVFKPNDADITKAAVQTKMKTHGTAASIGGSTRSADDFVLTGASLIWTLKKPAISQHSLRLTHDQLSEQGITLVSTLASAGGVMFSVAKPV